MRRKTKTKLPDLVIALDFGGSLTKVIFRGRDRNPQILCMEPEAIELPKSAIINYERNAMGMSALAPADRAWVGVGDQYYALGSHHFIERAVFAFFEKLAHRRVTPTSR